MNPFDRQLADRVRRAFDAYDEMPEPDAFAALSETMRRQEGKPSPTTGKIITIGFSLAAAASVVLAVGLSFFQTSSEPMPTVLVPQAEVHAEAEPPSNRAATVAAPAVIQQPAIVQVPAESPRTEDAVPEPMLETVALGVVPSQLGSGIDSTAPARIHTFAHTVWMPDPVVQSSAGRRKAWNRQLEWVAGTVSSWSTDRMSAGVGYTAGLVGHMTARQGFRISVGALVNHNRFVLDSDIDLASRIQTLTDEVGVFSATVPGGVEYDLMSIDLPVHATLDFAQVRSGTFSVSTGVSAMWFVRQTFRDETLLLSATVSTNPDTGVNETTVRTTSQTRTETIRSLGRSETAGYVHFALGFTAHPDRLPLGVDLYAKIPVSEATRRNLVYGMGGITVRYRVR
jgi:hypothetical protein